MQTPATEAIAQHLYRAQTAIISLRTRQVQAAGGQGALVAVRRADLEETLAAIGDVCGEIIKSAEVA